MGKWMLSARHQGIYQRSLERISYIFFRGKRAHKEYVYTFYFQRVFFLFPPPTPFFSFFFFLAISLFASFYFVQKPLIFFFFAYFSDVILAFLLRKLKKFGHLRFCFIFVSFPKITQGFYIYIPISFFFSSPSLRLNKALSFVIPFLFSQIF